MSLLGDLQLDFEALADDPIEMGIHYGKSVLQVVSSRVSTPKQYLDNLVTAQKVRRHKPKTLLVKSSNSAQTVVGYDRTKSRAAFRRDYQTITATAYARKRQLVGSL